MNKEKFLKELTKKLSVLSFEERQDTINEYSDIIEEKIKHGKTEIEAVSEFGSIDELAKEILSAYKIDPKYSESDKSIADNVEDIIKKGAKKISDVTEDVVENFKKSDFEWTTNNVVEIAIKVILVLIVLAFLKIPFYIIGELGSNIFTVGITPFSDVASFIWKFIVELSYFVICVLLIVNIITKYTNRNKTIEVKTEKKDKKKDKIVEETTKEEVKTERVRRNSASDTLSEIMIAIIKVFCIICFLIPAWGILVAVAIGIAVGIYLIIKGVLVYGILVLLVGIFIFIASFTEVIFNLLFSKKKVHLYGFLISIIMCIVGLFLTLDYLDDFKYVNNINNYSTETIKYNTTIDSNTIIDEDYNVLIDETLNNNNIRIEVTYISEYIKIDIIEDEYNNMINIDLDYLRDIGVDYNIIEDLKNKTIHNYSLLNDIKVNVYMNSITKNNLLEV